jgi:hypothetical protein
VCFYERQRAVWEVVMKGKMLVISIAFVLISCATSPPEPESTPAPKHPMLEEAMATIAGKLPERDHQIVAVLPFTERGIGRTLLGEYVAEKLMMALSNTKRVELVERSRLQTVYQEQKLGATGLIDDETAASIGNIAGAQAAVVGVLTTFGDCWELTARLLGTSDARVLTMAGTRFSAEGVPPNLAGQPIEPHKAQVAAQTESVPQAQAPSRAQPRPIQRPAIAQKAPTLEHQPLNIVLDRCLEIKEPAARRRCFIKLRNLILSEPTTPRKIAARKCLKIQDPRRRTRCLRKVFGEAQK